MVETQAKTIYLADTNALFGFALWKPISLKFNEPFWSALSDALARGDWVLLDVVVAEILYDADLVKWCKEQEKKGLITKIDDDIRERGIEINSIYPMIDQVTFKSEADTYLIAFAEANQLGIFSRENGKTNKDSNGNDLYKIPNVCGFLSPKIKNTNKPKAFLESIGFN
jgi:hypothetical protein